MQTRNPGRGDPANGGSLALLRLARLPEGRTPTEGHDRFQGDAIPTLPVTLNVTLFVTVVLGRVDQCTPA